MANTYIQTSADATEVRIAIDVLIDDEMLPDSMILSDVFTGRAEDWVTRQVDVSKADFGKVKRLCILRCAYIMIGPVRSRTGYAVDEMRVELEKIDFEKKRANLFADMTEELKPLPKVDEPTGGGTSLLFTTASGGRG